MSPPAAQTTTSAGRINHSVTRYCVCTGKDEEAAGAAAKADGPDEAEAARMFRVPTRGWKSDKFDAMPHSMPNRDLRVVRMLFMRTCSIVKAK